MEPTGTTIFVCKQKSMKSWVGTKTKSFVEATMLLLLFECNRDLERAGNVTIYKHVTSLKFTARLSVLQHKKAPSGGQHLFATHKPKYLRTRTKQSTKNSTKKTPKKTKQIKTNKKQKQ